MRPGLVAVGAALLVVAAGGVAALALVPIPANGLSATSTGTWLATPGQTNATTIEGGSTVDGVLSVHWVSSAPLTVAVFGSGGCPPDRAGCADWSEIDHWNASSTGWWNVSGTLHFPYLVTFWNPGSGSATVHISATTTVAATASLSPVSQLFLGLSVGAVGFIGGVALYLGLFLRGGVYADRPRPPPPSPPDPGH